MVPQWIIELEAPVDVTALLRDHEDEETAIQQARLATQVVESSHTAADAVDAPPESAAVAQRPGRPTLEQLLERAQGMGVPRERYAAYADRRWGRGWRINPHGRGRAWDELDRYRNDPAGYLDKIEAELNQMA